MKYIFDSKKSGWAKIISDGNPGLSIFEHCRNVGWVASELIKKGKSIPDERITCKVAALLASIHDIGKWSPGFLHKCLPWLEQEGLKLTAEREAWEAQKVIRHEKHSQDSIQIFLQKKGYELSEATAWAMVAGAHHGKMHLTERFRRDDIDLIVDVWNSQRHKIIESLEGEFGCKIPSVNLKKTDPIVPWLMGLTSVADWIGSDEMHFPAEKGLTVEESRKYAKLAIGSIGLECPEIERNLTFEEIFGFIPNELQKKALSVITQPGVYVIEAPMGLGKTEAALACAYDLLQAKKASGLYFALPTQLTSNRIHIRVSDFIDKITKNNDKARLAHANSWLEDSYYQPRPVKTAIKKYAEDAVISRDWFASAKRALLANFGVGTIDQALMSIVAVKHFFVRRFALAGKVIIIDEVHSYDYFTGTLIRRLIQELQQLGCTIIILSATLLPKIRNNLIGIDSENLQAGGYPLITGKCSEGTQVYPQEAKPEPRPMVSRLFKKYHTLLKDAMDAARKGARVLWVCNTVNNAQKVFSELQQDIGYEIGLLHSRFPHFMRQEQEEYWMERLGKNDKHKNGCILVSTQIVEQSVDIDSDILISELAPIDMLLQRMGRLWRHLDHRPASKRPVASPEVWILEEELPLPDLKKANRNRLLEILGVKAKVYPAYILLKTYETLHDFENINLAGKNGNTDIRKLLQLTYSNSYEDPEPWEDLHNDLKGTEYAEKELALSNTRLFAKAALEDEEGKQTRLIEIETIPLIIAKGAEGGKLILLNGEEIDIEPDVFNIKHARSIHQNIIRVHAWPFEIMETHPSLSYYLKGKYVLAYLGENNKLSIKGLKEGVKIEWDEIIGIKQTYSKGDNNESCD